MRAYEVILKINDMVTNPVAKIISSLGRAENSFGSVANAAKNSDNSISLFGRAFQFNQIVTAISTIKQGFEQVMAPSMNFNAQMSELKAVAEPTSQEFNNLREKALQLGRDTKFSATEAALGLTELSKAGFTASDAAKAIDGVLNLAAASGLELGRASEIVANNMAAFALPAEDASRVSDVFAKTVNMSTVGMEDMAEAMKYIAPTAKSLGMSIEETSGMIGVLGDYGMKGSMATRALGTSLLRFTKPTDEMSKMMQKLGLNIFDSSGQFKGMANVIEELASKTQNLTQEQRLSAISTLFGAEASGEVLTLMSAQKKIALDSLNEEQKERIKAIVGVEEYNKAMANGGEIILKGANALRGYTGVLDEAAGASDKMAKTMIDNLKGDVTILGSSLEGLMITIGDSGDGMMRSAVQSITNFINTINAGYNGMMSHVNTLFSAFSPIFNVLQSSFGNLANMLGVGGDYISGFNSIIISITQVVKDIVVAVAPFVQRVMDVFTGLVVGFQNYIMPALSGLWEVITPIFQAIGDAFSDMTSAGEFGSTIMRILGGAIEFITPIVGALVRIFSFLARIIGSVADVVMRVINRLQFLSPVVSAVFNFFSQAISWVFTPIEWLLSLIEKIIDGIDWLSEKFEMINNLNPFASAQTEAEKLLSTQQKLNEATMDYVQTAQVFGKIGENIGASLKSMVNADGIAKKLEGIDKINSLESGLAFAKNLLGGEETSKKAKGVIDISNKASMMSDIGKASMASSSNPAKKGIDTVNAGGQKQLHVTVNIDKLQAAERMEVNGADTSDTGLSDLENKILSTVTRAINGAIQLQTSF